MGKRKYVDRLKRLESLNLVSFSHKDTKGRTDLEIAGRTLDLSEGGILLEIPAPLPSTSEEVEVTLGVRGNVIKARGKIIHQRELDNGHFGLGISFIDLSDGDSVIITRFLNEE
ncbi:MAG: PilZ domain-containing protein [Deltaproteobacteria bacterium]|nr:PilZ domain-containing protein [Deltaproteobacteria bacterium]